MSLKTSNLEFRWMIRKDFPEVINIENTSQLDPWSNKQLFGVLGKKHTIGLVATLKDENKNKIVGYVIYELQKQRFDLQRFAVHHKYRRKGIGKLLIEKIVKKPHSSINKRKEIHIVLRETNLEAQLFFKSQKFKAIEVLRQNFEDTQEDGYLMRLALTQKEPQLV
jgi:ribosomal-protein-alanine N-acetyltransferase